MTIPQADIFTFLQVRGYEIKNWLWQYEDETFPSGLTHHATWTFTACKDGEEQCEETIYTEVFDREVKLLLNQI